MGEGTWHRFTFHVDFMATDEYEAMVQAEAYAQGLICLRGEVDSHTARVSADGNWSISSPVFCGSPGPAIGDVCIEPAGHLGGHHGPGATREWTNDDVPRAPDNVEGL